MRRLFVYAIDARGRSVDDYVRFALAGLREHAASIVVVTCGAVNDADRASLSSLADVVIAGPEEFAPHAYVDALDAQAPADFDEVVLTGDSWFGPFDTLPAVLERMGAQPGDFWTMVEDAGGPLPDAAYSATPRRQEPWLWTALRPALLRSPGWADYRSDVRSRAGQRSGESDFATRMGSAGLTGAVAFSAGEFGNPDPSIYSPDVLIAAGAPLLRRLPFTLFPPFLQQHAIIGRDVATALSATGYPMPLFWQHLARAVAPKALNTAAGMLEVPTGDPTPHPQDRRVVVVAHISDIDGTKHLLNRLAAVPAGFDLVITTPDGRKADTLNRVFTREGATRAASIDIRVTPSRRGRDMSDFFIACRDLLVSGHYDLVIKVHSRSSRRKTLNLRRYFRRYQLDNLLASEAHVNAIFDLFEREPGLGLVFPPMMHIGFATMGRGWSDYLANASTLHDELGIRVPVDTVSPLAPFGGMWIGRPEALALLAERRWLYRDYGKPGRQRYNDLARLQERVVVAAAAERGFHSRTVLTPAHAAISHTALEYKSDQLFSTTRGYPIDAIDLIHRAGPTGRGGVVGLSRMYLRLNHRFLAKLALPVLAAAQWTYLNVRGLLNPDRKNEQRSRRWGDEEL